MLARNHVACCFSSRFDVTGRSRQSILSLWRKPWDHQVWIFSQTPLKPYRSKSFHRRMTRNLIYPSSRHAQGKISLLVWWRIIDMLLFVCFCEGQSPVLHGILSWHGTRWGGRRFLEPCYNGELGLLGVWCFFYFYDAHDETFCPV